jgi:hypothetical protein
MNTVYRLRDDVEGIASMQSASLAEGELGLRITHGAIGSDHWWRCLSNGQLAVHKLRGKVSGFWPGQWEAGPAEFALESESGDTSHWLCNVEPARAKLEFVIGRVVELDYVEQELKVPFEGSTRSLVPLSIALG